MMRKISVFFLALLVLTLGLIFAWPVAKYQYYELPPDYRELVENYDIPPMPDGWDWHQITAKDGTNLRWGMGPKPDAVKASLLIIPGFSGSLELFGEHLTHWQNEGYQVVGLDPRGQGGSDRYFPDHPDKPYIKDFGLYVTDLNDFIRAHQADFAEPLIVVGVSMGSQIAFRALGETQTPMDGLVMISPAFKPRTAPLSYGSAKFYLKMARLFNKADAYTLGRTDWRPWSLDMQRPSECSNNLERLNRFDALYATRPELRHGGATNQWLWEFVRSGELVSQPKFYKQIQTPIEMVFPSNDVVVDPDVPMAVCEEMSTCESVVLPSTGHCLPQESDAAQAGIYASVERLRARLDAR